MINRKSFVLWIVIAVTLLSVQTAFSQNQTSRETKLANIRAEATGVRWEAAIANAGITLTVIGPDGTAFRRQYEAGASPSFGFGEKGAALTDGTYTYELVFAPVLSKGVKDRLAAARKDGNDAAVVAELRRSGQLPAHALIQSGSFTVQGGVLYAGNEIETTNQRTASTENLKKEMLQRVSSMRLLTPVSYRTVANYDLRRTGPMRMAHARPFTSAPDQVIPDDLIVQGSVCAGLDCVNNENFGFDTIRLKENNTRIQFDDTSATTGFAGNNWQIRANSSASGGENFLGFVDQGVTGNSETGTISFLVSAGAAANSMKVASNSKVGFRTATPVLDLHVNTTDTPAMRLEQNNSGGFAAQTWDIGANEANFFVRDVTSGSRLPLRIRPGAPTSSLDIAANGNVGVGTQSPSKRLHVFDANAQILIDRPANTAGNYALVNFGTNGSARFFFGMNADSDVNVDKLSFFDSAFSAVNPVMTFTGGNVGIGTQAPTDKLSVNGTASKPGGGTWAVFSDERLKNINGKFTRGLKDVMQLQPLRYQYRPNNALNLKSETEYVGFGAQAVQKVIPEAVTANSAGYLMVNSDPIIWTMLNAIKEQQQQIAQLKEEVQKLRAAKRPVRHRTRR